ncbi:DUF58 domain-containing protein [Alteromonas sp. 07-89-2]|uniref:DUF58 domain-containing protein n=1 Tax=Alteromonas sp. 07-89-2 TaxID=2607609 RepID=UPI0020A27225|nr:DUF58 domain-containing protein [Alteromonas sp. 07-89-2]
MGRKRSTIRGRGLDFSELRDYRPGDDIRNVDWRVTNRMGKPYVRLYCEEKDCSAQLNQDTFLKELCSYSIGDRSPLAV